MNYLQKVIGVLGICILSLDSVNANYLGEVSEQKFQLAHTLSAAAWEAACSGGAFSSNQCFGGSPSSNANMNLVLRVTNINTYANTSLSANYGATGIWIGYFPATTHSSTTTAVSTAVTSLTQATCAAYNEIGWPIPTTGINRNTSSATTSLAGSYVTSNSSSTVPAITMSNVVGAISVPLYIICVGRSALSPSEPAGLGNSFTITWS